LHPSQVAAERLLLIHISGPERQAIVSQLREVGYDVCAVAAVDDALPVLAGEPVFPIVLIVACGVTDRMRSAADDLIDGVEAIRRASSMTQVVVAFDSSADIELCCRAVNTGVTGFVEFEGDRLNPNQLRDRLDQARSRFTSAVDDARKLHSGEVFETTGIIGVSRGMAELLSQTARAAEVSDAPVLIYGESGTGKQLLAEMAHRLDSKRATLPFLSVNCSAITGSLAESELFGHVKGAYTGATESRAGYFRSADGGTVFLDEISELDAALQPKLLRFLQEGVVMPVGSDREFHVDVRVIAASNRRLPALVEEGTFRLDLYQRLNVITLELPPLRERREDIPLLIDFFVKKYARAYDKPVRTIDRRVYELLSESTLRGNVRELENAIRRAVALKRDGSELVLADLPASMLNRRGPHDAEERGPVLSKEILANACRLIASQSMTLPEFIEECERLVLAHTIAETDENPSRLSERLGVSKRTLYNKRRKYRL
jgi:DNA-binding NtrC family response regulator